MNDATEATEEEKQSLRSLPTQHRLHVEATEVLQIPVSRVELSLYCSHLLSTWGQRSHEFFIGLALLDVAGGSLLLVSCYGLVDGLAVALAAPGLGQLLDRTERLRFAAGCYLVQNVGIALSACSIIAGCLSRANGHWPIVLAIVTIAMGSASSVGALGATLSVEKEWTKALHPRDSRLLAKLNAGMRRIDLMCLVLSPIVVGFLMTYVGNVWAAAAILAWNILSWPPEVFFLRFARSSSSELRQRPSGSSGSKVQVTISGWSTYFRQHVWPAAVSLSLLYLTVLSFGLLMTAYLNWCGLSEAVLSVYRGFGAAAGILATFVFPRMQAGIGLRSTGMLGACTQAASLTVAIAPALVARLAGLQVPGALLTHILVGGLVASRFGLWLFDLSVSQLLQDEIAADELGGVNGVQGSFASIFQSLSYLAGIVSSRPEDFVWLMLGSWLVVISACGLYMYWACSLRMSYIAPCGARKHESGLYSADTLEKADSC